ncbi:MAG: hypothetical protein E7158_05270 [Firmicutes bacterium]|nr:hypothetical protein [Bacillota bacterium]
MFKKIKKLLSNISIEDVVIFVIPFLVCTLMLYVYYPGIYNYDVFNQLSQIETGKYTTGHPFISTFYLMIFHKYIGIKSSLPMFQIIWFSLLCTAISKYTRKSKFHFVLQIIVVLFFSINPLISTSIISNNKDSLFLLIFMTICYFLWVVIDNNFICSKRIYIFLAFFMIFFGKVRHNGFYVNCVFITIFMSIVLIKTLKKDKKIILSFACSLVFSFILFLIPSKFYDVESVAMDAQSVGSLKALQFEGYLYNRKKLSKDEINELDKFINLESLSINSFNTSYMDPMIIVEKKDNYYDTQKFLKVSLKILLNHKTEGFEFFLKSTPIIWRIYLPEKIMHSYVWIDIGVPNRIESIDYVNKNSKLFSVVDSTLRKFQEGKGNKLIISIFYSPAFYMYLSILLTIILIIKNNKYTWLITFYNLINVGIISLSIPVQDSRYLLNGHGLLIILTIILIGTFVKNNKSKKI